MSDQEFTQDKIDELLDLTRENNRILRGMHRRMFWSQVFTFIYWAIILGVAGWGYYFLQPYMTKYLHSYEVIMKSIDAIDQSGKSLPANLQGILDKVK
jgi:hypothetical protein